MKSDRFPKWNHKLLLDTSAYECRGLVVLDMGRKTKGLCKIWDWNCWANIHFKTRLNDPDGSWDYTSRHCVIHVCLCAVYQLMQLVFLMNPDSSIVCVYWKFIFGCGLTESGWSFSSKISNNILPSMSLELKRGKEIKNRCIISLISHLYEWICTSTSCPIWDSYHFQFIETRFILKLPCFFKNMRSVKSCQSNKFY